MRKNILRAMMPVAALLLAAACSDSTGPGAPELAEVRQDPVEQDGSQEVAQNQKKTERPLDQQREDGT